VQEQNALEQIVDGHYDRVFAYCLAILAHRERAEDACHDVFLRVQQNLDRLDHGRDCTPWLLRIARNRCYDILKREHRLTVTDELAGTLPDSSPGPEDLALANERTAAFVRALNQLNPNYREVLVLRDINGLSYTDAAQHLGIDRKRVKWMLFKARQRIKSIVEKTYETT
jgi:RNA polymerase sigma-70 factor (ECF subfamily)